MQEQEKSNNARLVAYVVGLAIVAVVVMWKVLTR
jgi:hypothetical protein